MNLKEQANALKEKIPSVYKEGKEAGHNEGYTAGHDAGYDEGYGVGKAVGERLHITGWFGSTYRIPDGTTETRISPFAYNWNIKKLIIPPSVKKFSNGIARQMYALTEVIFEDGGSTNYLGENTFGEDSALKSVYFGFTLLNNSGWFDMKNSTFSGCVALEEVVFTQEELSGNFYIHTSSVLKKQCVYDFIRKLKNQIGTANEDKFTIKLHNTVWANADDTTTEGYEAPPQYDSWKSYVMELGYLV